MAVQGAAPTELGTERISTLLRKYAVPGIIAMIASSLYNMVDSIFIGHIPNVGAYAISGLAVTFPLMNLSTALGTLVGVGGQTMVSVLLGQKNYDGAQKVLSNVVSLNTIIGVVFTTLCLIFLDPILYFFGASENTLPFAREYMVIILLGNVITHLYFGLNGVIRASGNPKTAMGLTIFTVTANAILDPVFIYVLDLGVKGAAIATVICQALALAYTIIFFLDKKNFLHFGKRIFQLDRHIAKASLSIGLGPFLMHFASCFVSIFINQQLRKYGGDLSIGAYGISNRITFMFLMINLGFNQGMQPIASFNYGARQYKRVKEVFWLTTKWMCLMSVICFLVSEFLTTPAVRLFTEDSVMIEKADNALRLMNMMVWCVGFGMVSGNFFQSLGMVKKSIFLSLTRQLLFLVPLVYLLPLWLGENGVWLAFPVSDFLSVVCAAVLIINILRKFDKLNDGDDPSVLGGAV
ncbi:MAG: MATE family efflux transporter [Bacteroidales bacterium]|nr:MATE family efflux transporter [Bacteroidales bacterium]